MRVLSTIAFALATQACFVSVDDFPVSTRAVGDACDEANPCGPGLDCWRADASPGPPGGVCTRACVGATDCPSGSNCVDVAGKQTCLPSCAFGASDSSKCRGRPELGCTPGNNCVPLCSSDAHCPGRYCDRKLGLCADDPSVGSGVPTTACLMESGCRGLCADLALDAGYCDESCVLGSACASDGLAVDLGCIDIADSGAQIGDVGRCSPSCSCPASGCGPLFTCSEVGSQRYCTRNLGPGCN